MDHLHDDAPHGPPHKGTAPDPALNGETGNGTCFEFRSLLSSPQPAQTDTRDERHPDALPNG